jgi:hypothetical protein
MCTDPNQAIHCADLLLSVVPGSNLVLLLGANFPRQALIHVWLRNDTSNATIPDHDVLTEGTRCLPSEMWKYQIGREAFAHFLFTKITYWLCLQL